MSDIQILLITHGIIVGGGFIGFIIIWIHDLMK